MCIESTLPSPTTQTSLHDEGSQFVQNTIQSPLLTSSWIELCTMDQGNHLVLTGPDGEPWLPDEPFQGYDGPSVFSPGAN
jgi:hypothetical protein